MAFAARPRYRHRSSMSTPELTGLRGHETDMPLEFTPAQPRRAITARAPIRRLSVQPQDEPSADLADEAATEILELLTALPSAGTTIALSTKNPQVTARARRAPHPKRRSDRDPQPGNRPAIVPTRLHRGGP